MDVFLKKYFFVVPVVAVVVCSALTAKAVNYYIESKALAPSSKPPKVPDDIEPAKKDASKKRSKNGAPLAKRNMFCAECAPVEPETEWCGWQPRHRPWRRGSWGRRALTKPATLRS